MHVFVSLVCNNKQICCFSCYALDTEGAECFSEDANVAPLTLDNQCMSEIPLSGNTVATQLISTAFFKTVFSMLTGVGLGEVKTKSMDPLSDFHVLAEDSALQTCRSWWLMLSQLWKERNQFYFLQWFCSLLQNVVRWFWTRNPELKGDLVIFSLCCFKLKLRPIIQLLPHWDMYFLKGCLVITGSTALTPSCQFHFKCRWQISIFYLDVLIRVLKSYVSE